MITAPRILALACLGLAVCGDGQAAGTRALQVGATVVRADPCRVGGGDKVRCTDSRAARQGESITPRFVVRTPDKRSYAGEVRVRMSPHGASLDSRASAAPTAGPSVLTIED